MMKYSNPYRIRFFLAFMAFAITHCTILLPPLSVTGTKTAAEKQIIGEQTELEKDVWMISSARTTSSVDLKQEKREKTPREEAREENAYTYKGLAIIEVFTPELAALKKDGVVGENNNGLVSNLLKVEGIEIPQEIQDQYKEAPGNTSYKTLVETVKQINQARLYIVEGYILNQKRIYPDFNPDKNELLKTQKSKYQGVAAKGDYIQLDTGEWVRKK